MPELTEEENARELERLNAKPWRGTCALCPYTLWCTDTEEEAEQLIGVHIAEKHGSLIRVWRDHA